MAITLWPSASEPGLASVPQAGRLAVIIDLLRGLVGAGGAYTNSNAHYTAAAAANQDSTIVLAAPGVVTGFDLGNTSAAWRYLKFYNKATAPTSADVPVRRVAVPPGGGIRANINQAFAAGISIRMTQGSADADATACVAGDLQVSIDYQAS